MELRLGDTKQAGELVNDIEELLGTLDKDVAYYGLIGRIMIERKLDWSESLLDIEKESASSIQKECLDLTTSMEQLPNVDPKLESVKQRCLSLLR